MIIVIVTDSKKAGSCNACNRFSTEHGVTKHGVVDVSLKSIAFRLCKYCRRELIKELQEHPI